MFWPYKHRRIHVFIPWISNMPRRQMCCFECAKNHVKSFAKHEKESNCLKLLFWKLPVKWSVKCWKENQPSCLQRFGSRTCYKKAIPASPAPEISWRLIFMLETNYLPGSHFICSIVSYMLNWDQPDSSNTHMEEQSAAW